MDVTNIFVGATFSPNDNPACRASPHEFATRRSLDLPRTVAVTKAVEVWTSLQRTSQRIPERQAR